MVPGYAAALAGFAGLSGCTGEAPSARPAVPVVSGPIVEHQDASAGAAFPDASFPCCATSEATAAVGAYVGLGEALASDDATAATERAAALMGVLRSLPPDTAGATQMVALATRMAGQDIGGVREEFLDLTTPMLELARTSRAEAGALRVAVAFCPMKPGRWLQVTDGIRNPYYGAEMLACGVFEGP
ncbi:MAG: hypothetical protein VX265_06505 [Myxococcota bacterium]|nr:hypothetical protein [Myxococcota bacterium]